MTFIDLIRHGETASNKEGRFRGGLDVPLNDRGRESARQLARALRHVPYKALYSSPLSRALDTLEPLSMYQDLPVITDDRLFNLRLPLWEGKTEEEVSRTWPEAYRQWITCPERMDNGGQENLIDVGRRALDFLNEAACRHQGEHIAVCSHRSVLRSLIALILEMDEPWFWKLQLDTASVTRVGFQPDRGYRLLAFNYNPSGFLP